MQEGPMSKSLQGIVVVPRPQVTEPEVVWQAEMAVQTVGGSTWGSSLCNWDSGAIREGVAWEVHLVLAPALVRMRPRQGKVAAVERR